MTLIGKWIELLARSVALLGGVILLVLALITVVSVTGRSLLAFGLRPIPGDFEIVEAGITFVVCAFFPWCQLKRGHASVAVFTDLMGRTANRIIDLIAESLLFVTAIILTWRHIYGMLDKMNYGETTFLLRFPLWWSYAGALVGLFAWIIIGAWCVTIAVRAFFDTNEPHALQGEVAQ